MKKNLISYFAHEIDQTRKEISIFSSIWHFHEKDKRCLAIYDNYSPAMNVDIGMVSSHSKVSFLQFLSELCLCEEGVEVNAGGEGRPKEKKILVGMECRINKDNF